ncbi:MAG: tetratricopeptide repeat protein [Spirochaetales bacterium]|nr:tetratricopeptide repeat protein [Spirochaetales bacterium]MBP7264623.1 tetratricopeptide repeat protein [Spirochaetia bacterium]
MRITPVAAVLACALAVSCSSPRDYYLEAPEPEHSRLADLFSLLDTEGLGVEERYAVIQKIGASMLEREEYGRLASFLSEEIGRDPDNPYNAMHMLTLAWAYSLQGAEDVAALYYDRILKNYPDLSVGGESVHFACLRRLIELVPEPERRIEFRRELLARFPDSIDMGTELFLMGSEYEELGDWDSALDAYQRFLPYYESEIPGHPNAVRYARTFVDLATIPKTWTFETLDQLVATIKQALAAGNTRALPRLRAGVGFFAMDWYQDIDAGNSLVLFDFGAFMAGGRIYYSDDLDPASNATEAFLKTWGWTERISTWYLYFRKVDFPADPEVHGRWEWAGIYFGEKMQ